MSTSVISAIAMTQQSRACGDLPSVLFWIFLAMGIVLIGVLVYIVYDLWRNG